MLLQKYEFTEKLCTGSFGQVFRGRHLLTNRDVAIKVEKATGTPHECKLLYYLQDRGCRNVPQVEFWGTVKLDGAVFRVLVMPLLQITMSHVSTNDETQIRRWVREMICILYQVHEAGILHRDVKPQNFMLSSAGTVYLIDFGLASVYVDDDFRSPLPAKPVQDYIVGTPKYVSLYVHSGQDPGRRDDLLSVGYIWLFLTSGGTLPWDGIVAMSPHPPDHVLHPANQERQRRKREFVASFRELDVYLSAVSRLDRDETPDYAHYLDIIAAT